MSCLPMKGPTLPCEASPSSATFRLALGSARLCTGTLKSRKRFSSLLWYCG